MARRFDSVSRNWALGLGLGIALLGWGGCAAIPANSDIVAASAGEVQEQAWQHVQALTNELAVLDDADHPGIAALVRDLRSAAARVEAGTGGSYDQLDPAQLIADNPHFWQALLEMQPGDTTLAVLEGMMLAAAGHIEGARDVLELVRAGPLLDEELGDRVAQQMRTMDAWTFTPPGIELLQVSGLPPEERWEPVKRLEAMHPESATAAMAVLKMRADLAGIELTAAGEDERMRDKILAAEPRAMTVLEEQQPLWAAIIKANGEAGDAGRRIARMLEEDESGVLNLTAADWEQLVADFDRIGLPDWAVRAVRMRAAESGGLSDSDLTALRQLLPRVLPAETATRLLDALEAGRLAQATLHAPIPEPTGTADMPIAPVVGGAIAMNLRRAHVILAEADGEPYSLQEKGAMVSVAENAGTLGDLETAEHALNEAAVLKGVEIDVARARLRLAMTRGDPATVAAAREAVLREDRRLKGTHFTVGNSYIMSGQWGEASDAFAAGFKNTVLSSERRAYAAIYAHCAAVLGGRDRQDLLVDALEMVEEDAWVARLIKALQGEVGRAQLLIEADEGRESVALGQRCEAHFVWAFTPGQTAAGRRAELLAARDLGVVNFIEYDFATAWLAAGGR